MATWKSSAKAFWFLVLLLTAAVAAAEPSAQHAAVSSAEHREALAKAAASEARSKILELELAATKKALQASEDLLIKARESHKSELEKVLADLLAAKAAASDMSQGAGQVAELENKLKTISDEFAQYRERQARVLKQAESKAEALLQRAESAEEKLQELSNADARAEKAESHLTELQEAINKAKKDLAARTEDLVALQHAWMPHWLQARYAAMKVLADDVHARVKPTVEQAAGTSKAYVNKALDATKDIRAKTVDAVKLSWEKVKPLWAQVVAAWERMVAAASPFIAQVKTQWHKLVQLASPHTRTLGGHANRYWSIASAKASELHARFAETQIGRSVDEGVARLQSSIKHALMQHELTARFATDKALHSLATLVLAMPMILALYLGATLLTLPFSSRRRTTPKPLAKKSVKVLVASGERPALSSSMTSSRVSGASQTSSTGDVVERKPCVRRE